MDTLTLVLLLALAIPCVTLQAEAETLTLDWDYPSDQLLEGFRVWRTPGACPPDARPVQPLTTTLALVRRAVDPSPLAAMACYTVTALTAWIATAPTWTPCATEGQLCQVSGGAKVLRYGAQGKYVYQTISAPQYCAHWQLGDPWPGYAKTCEVTPALGPPQESAPSNAVQQPASGIAAPTRFRLVPQE